jgi:hypothetical protein
MIMRILPPLYKNAAKLSASTLMAADEKKPNFKSN